MTKRDWDNLSDADVAEMVRRMQDDEGHTQSVLTRCRAKVDAGGKINAADVVSLKEIESASARHHAFFDGGIKTPYEKLRSAFGSPESLTPELYDRLNAAWMNCAADQLATNAAARACLQHA